MSAAKTGPRAFLVLHLGDPFVQNAIDMVRFLLNSRVRTRAHITIQARHHRHLKKPVVLGQLEGSQVLVGGQAGHGKFRTGSGFAYFLRCEVPGIRSVWYKPSLDKAGEIIPHITIYEGHADRSMRLAQWALEEAGLDFTFTAGKLEYLQKFSEPSVSPMKDRIDWSLLLTDPVLASSVGSKSELIARLRDESYCRRVIQGVANSLRLRHERERTTTLAS